MRSLTVFFFILATSLVSGRLQAQPADSALRKHAGYIGRTVGLDSAISVNVASVQAEYKESLYKVLNNKDLSEEQKTARVKELIGIKNKRLAAILTEDQFNKLVPTTEREKKTEVIIKKTNK